MSEMSETSNTQNYNSLPLELINPIRVDIKDGTVSNVYNTNNVLKINDSSMLKLKTYLETDGFLKININIDNLNKLYGDMVKNNNLSSTNTNSNHLLYATFGYYLVEFATTIGLFLLPSEIDTNNNTISVIIPNSLLTNKYKEYINLIIDDILINKIKLIIQDETQQKVIIENIKNVKLIVLNMFSNFNNGDANTQIKFANIMYFLINIVIILFIATSALGDNVQPNIIAMEVINMFSSFLGQFPNDKCYFNNQNVLLFEPNVCNNTTIVSKENNTKNNNTKNNDSKNNNTKNNDTKNNDIVLKSQDSQICPQNYNTILVGIVIVGSIVIIYLLFLLKKHKKNEKK